MVLTLRSLVSICKSRSKQILLPSILLGVGVVYFFGWSKAPIRAQDTLSYQQVAQDFLKHDFTELRVRPPGYALILLCTGSVVNLNRLLFAVALGMHLASAGMLFRLLVKTGLSRWLCWLFLVLSLTPPYVECAEVAMTEVVTRFLVILGVVLTVEGVSRHSAWRFAAAGLSLGYAGWTHPIFITAFVPILGGLCVARWTFHWSPLTLGQFAVGSGYFGAAGAGAIGVLILFNWWAYGFKGVSPFAGIALTTKTARFIERAPASYGVVRRILVESRDRALLEGNSHSASSYIWKARPLLQQATGIDGQQLDSLLKRLNLDLIKRYPLLYLQNVGYAMIDFWTPSSSVPTEPRRTLFQVLWALVQAAVLALWAGCLLILSGGSLFIRRGRYRANSSAKRVCGVQAFGRGVHLQILGSMTVCWVSLIACAFGTGEARYRSPVDLILMACAFQGLGALAKLLGAPSDISERREISAFYQH